jgi:hypothetical protein
LSAPGKGIDDIRQSLGDGFLDFWRGITEKVVEVSSKTNSSALCVKLLLPELLTIRASPRRDDYEAQIISLAGRLESVPLDKLASAVKEHLGIGIAALKQNAAQRNHDDASELALPSFYFDGMSYFRPYQGGFERLSREDAALDLRKMGFRHRLAAGCELTPCEVALHRLQRSIASTTPVRYVAVRLAFGRKAAQGYSAHRGRQSQMPRKATLRRWRRFCVHY